MSTAPQTPERPAPRLGRGARPPEPEDLDAGLRIEELEALHSRIRSIFILMLALTAAIFSYMAIRIFVLRDVRTYSEFLSLCLFALACFALCIGQVYCLRHIRRDTRVKIEEMTFGDELTGVYNYRFLEQRLVQELHRAKRHSTHLSVIYFDIDHFKQVNDTFGHEAGNAVLRQIAQTATVSARREDFIGRLGGDEFLFVLPDTDGSGALIAAERVRTKLNALELLAPDGHRIEFLGYSMGVASYPTDAQAPVDLIRAADHAMYRAKKSGGNRVCI